MPMWGGAWGGHWYGFWWLMPLFWVVVIAVVIALVLRSTGGRASGMVRGWVRGWVRLGASLATLSTWLRMTPQSSSEPVSECNILPQYFLVPVNCPCDVIDLLGCHFEYAHVRLEVFSRGSQVMT
jgi:hypothetical protein